MNEQFAYFKKIFMFHVQPAVPFARPFIGSSRRVFFFFACKINNRLLCYDY